MPELIFLCGQDEYVCTGISVKMYRRYTEIMEKNEGESVKDAFEANAKILSEIFGVTLRRVEQADPEEVLFASKEIHFAMQEIINQKFLELNPSGSQEKIEQEKSIFDEYDEENGYNDKTEEEKSFWKICRENVDRVIKLCIRLMNNSYEQCMEADVISLLDHLKFEIKTLKEEGKNQKWQRR